jgi:hypothetical protein
MHLENRHRIWFSFRILLLVMTVFLWSSSAWAAGTSGTLSFSDSDSDLVSGTVSITRTIGGKSFTISATPSSGGLYYEATDLGLYAFDDATSSGTKITIAVESGYIFDISSFKAAADNNNITVALTYADGSLSSFAVNSIGASISGGGSGLTTVNPTIKNIKQVVLTSSGYAVFQDIALSNIRAIPPVPTATTGSATSISATGATLNATVNDNGDDTTVQFNYGLTSSYTLTSSSTTVTSGTGSTPVSISIGSLGCNILYHFQVQATNGGGTTTGSDATFTTTACVPGAPTIGTATAGSGQASVAFSAPGSDGGASISGYTVTSSPGSLTGTGSTSPILVTGLTNGTAYTFTVTATNSVGTSAASAASNSVKPMATQTITFNQPSDQSFGTTPTLSATTTASGLTVTFSSGTTGVCTITSGGVLTFLTTGTCTIKADQAGDSATQAATTVSQSFTVNAVAPGAPTIGTATAGDATASVSFTAPSSNGGSTITNYRVTSSGGQTATGTASPITVSGLTNGTSYTFIVQAYNSVGWGTASAASNSVTPQASQSITFANPGTQNFGTTPTLTATSDSGLTVTFSSGTTSVCTITSGGALAFGNTGTCTINADQSGNSAYSAATTISRSFTVAAVVPGAPSIGTATAGDGQVTVTFSAPSTNGGATISIYTVTSSPGSKTGTGGISPIIVSGLTNSTAYTFTVTATNSAGTGLASAASNSATPKSAQTITFANPGAQNFGTTPTLAATTTATGLTVSFSSSTPGVCTITSGGVLAFVTTGTCTIDANQAGNSAYSAATTISRSFAVNAVVPGAPSIGTATAGAGQASVAFTAPTFTGGTGITSYTVTSAPGDLTGTGSTSPITVTGLSNGTAYTFTVKALNSAGASAASAASNSVTPMITQTITFTDPGTKTFGTTPTLTATSDSGLTVTFTSSTTGVCTITTGGVLTFVTAGTCTINADQAGNGTYTAAATVTRSFTVNPLKPGAPTIGTATAGNRQATVSFTAPSYTGGESITSYTVTSSPGGITATGTSSPITVTGLSASLTYTFTVTATNSAGTGVASAASNSILCTPAPTGTSQSGSTSTTEALVFNAIANATSGPFTAIAIDTPPSSGQAVVDGLNIIYVPDSTITSTQQVTFTYTLTNSTGTSAPITVTVTVTPATANVSQGNRPPGTPPPAWSVNEFVALGGAA